MIYYLRNKFYVLVDQLWKGSVGHYSRLHMMIIDECIFFELNLISRPSYTEWQISRINAFAKELEAELDMSLISPQQNIKLEEDEGEADGDGEDGVHDLSKELVLYSCHITYVRTVWVTA